MLCTLGPKSLELTGAVAREIGLTVRVSLEPLAAAWWVGTETAGAAVRVSPEPRAAAWRVGTATAADTASDKRL